MTRPITNDGPAQVVLTAEQWNYIVSSGQAIERQRRRLENPEPDTGENNPPTWENQ